MVSPVTFEFAPIPTRVAGDRSGSLRAVGRKPGVFRIFDLHGNLIILDKTSDLTGRIERSFSEKPESRALDLRKIAGRIEYCRTDSALETQYLLHSERRRWFPTRYHRMRTIPRFYLLKINRRQRFPRIYPARQVRPGVRYFGPFRNRAELDRLKTTLERAFRLRPCEYNIRGDDPYPDCLYFQMRTCSRPCNGDISREDYLTEVDDAIRFIEGRDEELTRPLAARMQECAESTRFEEAARLQKRIERIEKARKDHHDTFHDLWSFDILVVMDAASVKRRKIAFVRSGRIVRIEEHGVDDIRSTLESSIGAVYRSPDPCWDDAGSYETHYDDFCLVSQFLARPVSSVRMVPLADQTTPAADRVREMVTADIEMRRTKRARPIGDDDK